MRDHSGSIDGIKLGGDFGHRFVTDFGRFRGQFGGHFGTMLAAFLESSFGLISCIVLVPILVVLWSHFGPKFGPNLRNMRNACFLKTNVSSTQNGRFVGAGVPK